MRNLFVPFILMAGLLAQPLHAKSTASDEYLELINPRSDVNEDGFIVFTGFIENSHPLHTAADVGIYITLKKEGDIIDILVRFPDNPFEHIAPGEERPYQLLTSYREGDYDEHSIRVAGEEGFVFDRSLITGEVIIVEESLTWKESKNRGETSVFGEIYNGTNAVIGRIKPIIELFDGSRFLGLTGNVDLNGLSRLELLPGETVEFWGHSAVGYYSWDTYNPILTYEPLRLFELVVDDTPTITQDLSWGHIKAQGAH